MAGAVAGIPNSPWAGGNYPSVGAPASMAAARGPKRKTAADMLNDEIPNEAALSNQGEANAGQSRQAFIDSLNGGQDALDTSIKSAMSSAMPEFSKAMQGVQETEISRGVGTGGLGTSYEGDLESAFQRNIANAAGSQALGLYGEKLQGENSLYGTDTEAASQGRNRYLDLLTGQRDYDTAQQNAKNKRKSGLFGFLGGLAGGVIGSVVPGIGTAAGATLGSGFGEAVGG